MIRRALAAGAAAALLLPAAGAAKPSTGFAFGRTGGNIVPFTVTIANDGAVRTYGPVRVDRATLTPLQLANLNRVATAARFTALPGLTRCPHALPDIATTFIRVGAETVRVHGSCAPAYSRLWKALAAAVRLSS